MVIRIWLYRFHRYVEFKEKQKVPHSYSRAEENARFANGVRDDALRGVRDQGAIFSSARRICSSSAGDRTVRKSRSTRPSSTRATIGGLLWRSRAASSSALRDSAVTASRKVGRDEVGAEPPPTSDSPEIIVVFKCVAALSCFSMASARARISWAE